jgi:hypothetical protein
VQGYRYRRSEKLPDPSAPAVTGPIWPDRSLSPDRPRSPDLGPMTQLAVMLAKDVLRVHHHLLTAAPPEGLRPRLEQPLHPTLPPAFPQLPRKTNSSTSPSLPPSSMWRGLLPPPWRATGMAEEQGMEASPRYWGCGGRRQRRSGGSTSSGLAVFAVRVTNNRS